MFNVKQLQRHIVLQQTMLTLVQCVVQMLIVLIFLPLLNVKRLMVKIFFKIYNKIIFLL